MTNEEFIWRFLADAGYNNFGIAGIMGNLYAESCLNPQNLQNSTEKRLGMNDAQYTAAVDSGAYTNFVHDSGGYGLAQWTYWSRKEGLLNYAKSKGKSIGDLQMQLEYFVNELARYKGSNENVKNAKSIQQASDFIVLNYERPASVGASASAETRANTLNKRAGYGQQYYNKYATTVVAPSPTPAPTAVTTKSPIDRVIAIAKAEEGYLEKKTNSQLDDKTANAGSNNWTKYARDLDALGNFYNGKKNGYAWCDVFVDWCFVQAFGPDKARELLCQPIGSAGAGCTYSARYYKTKGQLFKTPQPGDQIFFGDSSGNCSHTGLVVAVDSSKVYTVEGNTSSAAGVVANGGCVRAKSYALNYKNIYGYGRPNWALVPQVEEEDDDMITQEQFNQMMDNYLKELSKQQAYAWELPGLNWAQTNGIMVGDDTGNLMPHKFLTRGEAAAVVMRLAEKLNK